MNKILKIFSAVLLLLSLEKVDAFQTEREKIVELPPKAIVAQTFTAHHNNLSMIKIIGTFNPKYLKSGKERKDALVLHLKSYNKDNPFGGKELAVLRITGSNIGNYSTLPFKFDPIKDSADKKFIFYIENVEKPIQYNKMTTGPFLAFSYTEKGDYREGKLLYQGVDGNLEDIQGDLAFWSFYSVYPHEFILGTAKDFLVKFWQDKAFLIFYISVISFLIYLTYRSG